MIFHEFGKKKREGPVEAPTRTTLHLVNTPLPTNGEPVADFHGRVLHGNFNNPPPAGTWRDNYGKIFWDKMRFSKWIEEVKREWRMNDMVTMKNVPILPDHAPIFYGLISWITEVYYHAPASSYEPNEPLVIGIKVRDGKVMPFSPPELRHMTEKEIEIALSRDHPTFSASLPPSIH